MSQNISFSRQPHQTATRNTIYYHCSSPFFVFERRVNIHFQSIVRRRSPSYQAVCDQRRMAAVINLLCFRSKAIWPQSSNLNKGEALAVHSLSDPTQNAIDRVESSESENAVPPGSRLYHRDPNLPVNWLNWCLEKSPTKSWISRLRDV
ncbi:uncharacterized protein LOC110263329 isoform X2 [Arachis ipaensis]|uniref:uncharacterized protein LOC110263329 isoform X2 n=1 Tax=Arachis ipaensis TaxID=130454 RepID=UPI000A2B8F75|nr:uncharacterized protein LOC110263329 isoform X2 [Arachis ipaensis]XP_025657672.1 uncharacterized protein LOC112754290 [Arachis hypogaea]